MRRFEKKARFLDQENREYRGHRSVQDFKTRAARIERRKQRQRLLKQDHKE